MAVFTGKLTGAHAGPMTRWRPRVFFILNRATIHGGTLVVDQPVEARLDGLNWSVNVEPTYTGEFYRVEVWYFNDFDDLVDKRTIYKEIQVSEQGGDLGGSVNAILSPDSVVVSLTEPQMEWSFWLQAAIGDPDDGVSTGSGDLYMRKA